MVQPNQIPAASLNPDDLGQGGLFDAVLTIKSGKFQHNTFEAGGQQVKNFEAKITYLREDGNESEWTYSVGGGDAWMPSEDGMSAIPVREGGKVSASSAFGTFLQELVNAGFPKNRLTNRLDSLFGTQFLSRGATRKGAGEDSKQVLVASKILSLPGEQAGAATPTANATPNPPTPATPVPPTPNTPAAPPTPPQAQANGSNGDLGGYALTSALKLGDSFTLQQVMAQVMQDYASDPNRDNIAGYVFQPDFVPMLQGAGFNVNGFSVSK